mmetsp:Transcript_14631/g.25910  ORF Transcript_14631/g.25910 Transcript_14631/m.25910 type:complete len:628 (-) Transcript_14631:71-1954(-)
MTSTITQQNTNEYRRQLDALQKIRAISGGNELDLPQICVVGDQSSGKSSLLAELTGINFPVNSGICTRAPIVVECKLSNERDHDIYEIEQEDTSWKQVPQPEELAREITTMQNSALLKGDGPSKISTNEIRVRVCGPEQINIIVIDLPGIIHNGQGKTETKDLIDKYIQKKQTLILLVSEAKQDDEGCAAIGMAEEWDKDAERTLRVFTKCDTWDSEASKQRLVERMRERDCDSQNKLLPHAVICRMQGGSKYDPDNEVNELKAMCIPAKRAGVAMLKDRLPPLYAELIRTNLATLESNINSELEKTKDRLQEIGEEARSGDDMLRECQTVLLQSCVSTLEEPISEHFQKFKESIHATERKVQKPWSDKKLNPNVFECPFFQGGPALQSCMKEITDWWRPIMTKYVDGIEHVALNHVFPALESQTQGIPHVLRHTIHREWNIECRRVTKELKCIFENRLRKEIPWGTVNHYLTSKFKGEEALPDELIEDLMSQVAKKINSSNAEDYAISAKDIRTEIAFAKERWSVRFGAKGLHEQQQQRLFHAVKAVWTVEHKTFIDYILKETTENLMRERARWVSTALFTNHKIKEAAAEDPAHQQKRQDLKDKRERMEKCLVELQSMKPDAFSN